MISIDERVQKLSLFYNPVHRTSKQASTFGPCPRSFLTDLADVLTSLLQAYFETSGYVNVFITIIKIRLQGSIQV